MGVIFGKMTIEEPAFKVVLKNSRGFPYEVRTYGTRFVAETDNSSGNMAFSILAKYIGVFGSPENEALESISMTSPVVKMDSKTVAIAMTAPVVKSNENGRQVMQFMLPAKYDSLRKIPKPTNSAVSIREIPPATGAVHQYSGTYSDTVARTKVMELALQLREQDGIEGMTEEYAMQNHLWFGYNPPFTLPPFRRIEVWLPLTPRQVEHLTKNFAASDIN
jgi:hypothetical protein